MKSMVQTSHDFLYPVLHEAGIYVDGTLGNGLDSAFLLKKAARVIAFEIQPDIAQKTKEKLNDRRLEIHACSHSQLETFVPQEIDGAIFNFGWCPHASHEIATAPDTSLQAVKAAWNHLRPKGRMALVFYPHNEGIEEGRQILDWARTIGPRQGAIQKVEMLNTEAPWCLLMERKGKKHETEG